MLISFSMDASIEGSYRDWSTKRRILLKEESPEISSSSHSGGHQGFYAMRPSRRQKLRCKSANSLTRSRISALRIVKEFRCLCNLLGSIAVMDWSACDSRLLELDMMGRTDGSRIVFMYLMW